MVYISDHWLFVNKFVCGAYCCFFGFVGCLLWVLFCYLLAVYFGLAVLVLFVLFAFEFDLV